MSRIWSLLLLAFVALPAAPAYADDAAAQRARELFEEGKRSADAQNYAKALESFRSAYELDPRPASLYSIAWTLEQLGNDAEAADAYEHYLDDPATKDAKFPKVPPGYEKVVFLPAAGAQGRFSWL